MEENSQLNLVSRETSYDDIKRLVAEALHPLGRIQNPVTRYLDIGSGGGLPAIPILLSLRLTDATLVERTQKKAAALGRLLKSLGIKAHCICRTFEECEFTGKFDLVTLRYVKLNPKLLLRIRRTLDLSGVMVYYSAPEFTDKRIKTYKFKLDNSPIVKHYSLILP